VRLAIGLAEPSLQKSEKDALTHLISEHPDQPANISHGSGEPFHHTHLSDLRRFNREAEIQR
jgi:hypothetical protein